MIDISEEPLRSLRYARRWFPRRRRGKRPCLQTMYRWSTPPGYRGIVLWTAQVGSTRCTTRRACEEFIERITALAQGPEYQVAVPRPKASQQVDDALLKAGFDRPPAARDSKRSRTARGPQHGATARRSSHVQVDAESGADRRREGA